MKMHPTCNLAVCMRFLSGILLLALLNSSTCRGAEQIIQFEPRHPVSGEIMQNIPGGATAVSDILALETCQAFEFRGFLRTRDSDSKTRLWIHIQYYDKNQEKITPVSVWPMQGTETALKEPVSSGALPNDHLPQGWAMRKSLLYAMAFNARPDLSDLPNLEAVLMGRAIPKDYPAGTVVRLHRYLDLPSQTGVVTPIWTRYNLKIAGRASPTQPERRVDRVRQFWYGAEYLRVELRNRDRAGGTIEYDELQILLEKRDKE